MNQALLSNGVIPILFTETILLLISLAIFFWAVEIYKNWDFNSLKSRQYTLEKKNYFISTAIFFILVIKIVLFPIFAFTVDELSNIIPGAMCGAGAISANDFGMPIFILKLLSLFFGICWIIVNKIDLQSDYIFTKRKYELFFALFLFVVVEFGLQLLYFSNISLESPTSCCSVIYGADDMGSSIPFSLNHMTLSAVYLILFMMTLVSNISKNKFLSFFLGIFFIYFGYYFVLHVVGIYIYELPTHICPFCMLQKEYNYVGYVVWISLFLTSFFAMAPFVLYALLKTDKHSLSYKISSIFSVLLTVVSFFFIFRFYIKNGVWL